jgi:hypothetical protein
VNGVVDPVALTVPPAGYTQVVMNEEQRLPPGVGHAVTARSVNGVPVVAERRIIATEPRSGASVTLGSPLVATQWLFGSGDASEFTAEFLVVLNPSTDSIARLEVVALADGRELTIEGLEDIEVPPSGRVVLDINQYISREDLALLVTSTQPVVVERSLYGLQNPGVSLSMGVPLAAGVARPS